MPLYNPPSAVTDATISTSDITTNNASTSKHGFLKKLDNTATNFMDGTGAWSVPGGTGSVASDSLWDAKGDLAGGTGANTAAKVMVGSDGQVLTADSTQATGMKWAGTSVTRTKVNTYSIANGATLNIPDGDHGQNAGLLVKQDGNTALGVLLVYRSGSFNSVLGIGTTMEYRGSTFSAGSGALSWFIESNSAGARLSVKNNLGFDATVTVFDWSSAGNLA